MLDNNKVDLIPGEAFEMADHVTNNLIDKVSQACSWIAVPRGKKVDRNEAVQNLINEVEKNENLDPICKSALIYNARKIIKEYCNQNDILKIALDNLKENANPKDLDDDWLNFFMDKAKNISTDSIQIMFGKLLAEECNEAGSVSKNLIHVLSVMDSELAQAFYKLCKYKWTILDENWNIKENIILIPEYSKEDLERDHIDMNYGELAELSNIGLVSIIGSFGYSVRNTEEIICKYGDQCFKLISHDKNIPMGKIIFLSIASELSNVLIQDVDMEYLEAMKNYWIENDVVVEKIECTNI